MAFSLFRKVKNYIKNRFSFKDTVVIRAYSSLHEGLQLKLHLKLFKYDRACAQLEIFL